MRSAYFFLSDICGYTAYLTGTELDHAQEILSALFENQLNSIQPPLVVAKLEGDAIFAYLPAEQIGRGQVILDTVESIYSGFRKVQNAMHLNTTCTCRACRGINSLDLKFFIHYGEYAVQRLMGREELAGPAVILAHRLMKNSVSEATGLRAYALFTDAVIQAMQAQEAAAGFIPHNETYEHLGNVPAYVYDLHHFWEATAQQMRQFLRTEDADFNAVLVISAPPAVVWDIVTNPITRGAVVGGDVSLRDLQGGRIATGATYHCAHHDGTSTDEIIVDWEPLHYITTQERAEEQGMILRFMMTAWLTPLPDGNTRLVVSFGHPQSENPAQQPMVEEMWPVAGKSVVEHFETHANQAITRILADRALAADVAQDYSQTLLRPAKKGDII